jgi:hypothetical protein
VVAAMSWLKPGGSCSDTIHLRNSDATVGWSTGNWLPQPDRPNTILVITKHANPHKLGHCRKKRECTTELRFRKAMWRRETTAHSGDIGGGMKSPAAKPMSSGFAAEHRRLCRSEKLAVFGCPHGWLRTRQSADSRRECDMRTGRSGFGERCGRV